jgi:hypothetical protein
VQKFNGICTILSLFILYIVHLTHRIFCILFSVFQFFAQLPHSNTFCTLFVQQLTFTYRIFANFYMCFIFRICILYLHTSSVHFCTFANQHRHLHRWLSIQFLDLVTVFAVLVERNLQFYLSIEYVRPRFLNPDCNVRYFKFKLKVANCKKYRQHLLTRSDYSEFCA